MRHERAFRSPAIMNVHAALARSGTCRLLGLAQQLREHIPPVLAVEVSRLRLGGDVRIKWPGVLSGMPVL